ncbi:hypothetical protein [Algibacter sp. 2305UL17-15]|uniref:hypothetical protein n=1 Tax=Algibacter sp. 2305UL17-15 TaxID=3231268 RepID=UPI0034597110
MEQKEINFGKAALKTLELIIVKPLTLPFKIYKNALIALSNGKADDSEESNLSSDFPLYIWLISIFNALIVLAYPIGVIMAIKGWSGYFGSFGLFLGILVTTYFSPLYIGLIREVLQISLKVLLYLKIISKR